MKDTTRAAEKICKKPTTISDNHTRYRLVRNTRILTCENFNYFKKCISFLLTPLKELYKMYVLQYCENFNEYFNEYFNDVPIKKKQGVYAIALSKTCFAE